MLIGLCLATFFPHPINIQDAVIGGIFGYTTTTIVGFMFEQLLQKHPSKHPPIGMGDIKLIGVGGLWLGTYGLSIALIIACICGATWARINHTRYIPFGPFFLIGGFLSFITISFLL
jgi:prepilin signal peptidase PulO-like enzyme (type II secretory pathway)